MKTKEMGFVLSIDQASNAAGVSLWNNGDLIATTVLKSRSPTDPFSRRVQFQLEQLTDFLNMHLPPNVDIEKVLFEGVKARLVMVVVGAFLCCPRISAKMHESASFIYSTTWKSWARSKGATGPVKDIKGVPALRDIGFPVDVYHIDSDDIADSILIYLTWSEKYG